MPAFQSRRTPPLRGTIQVPGDKSISHRALILGALGVGETRIQGLLEGDDVMRTAEALRQLGASVERTAAGAWVVHGCGVGGLMEAASVLDLGNSGTGVRLLMGAVATHPITTFFTGDASLRRRPMQRVTGPLERLGASVVSRAGRLPCVVLGARQPLPVTHEMTVPSAQVKSALLLAGLNAPGTTSVIETVATRDHTERMLRACGASIEVAREAGRTHIHLTGQPELTGRALVVPADPSSAAFFVVAATLVEGSELALPGVCLNPLRTGLFAVLREMGADIAVHDERDLNGEPVGDLVVRASALKGIEIGGERAASMIDEYPVLSVAAAAAHGRTVMRGLGELRVKESDRLAAIAAGLRNCGVAVEETEDGIAVEGRGAIRGGGRIETHDDHRIAMAFAVAGMAAAEPVTIDEDAMIATSFPGFRELAGKAGAQFASLDA